MNAFPADRGIPRVDDRRVVGGIVYVIRNGPRWRDAPAVYGPRKTLNNRFVRWSRMGISARTATATCSTTCRAFTLRFGVDADVNRNQGEVNEDRGWNQAIKPCASQITSHLTRDCLHLKLGFSQLRFKFVGLDREDELANAQIYKIRYEGRPHAG